MPTSWKNGALPRMSSLKKFADYFGITVEELMGTQKKKKKDFFICNHAKTLLFVVSIILCYNSHEPTSREKRKIK